MSMDIDLAALQLAIQTEKDGYQFYSQAAERATHPLARATLAAFARDERHHIQIIESFYAARVGGREWPGFNDLCQGKAAFEQQMETIFHHALQNIEQTAQAVGRDVDVFCLAAKFEHEGVRFYTRLAEQTDDARTKEFYEFLRDMEREHLRIVIDSWQYLEDPAAWHAQQEKWIIEG